MNEKFATGRLAGEDEFPGLADGVYLNTAAEGLFLRSHEDAWRRYADAKRQGSIGREAHAAAEREAREACARLLSVHAKDIAFLASTSRGLDAAIKSIAWEKGDNIVLPESEFPASAFAASRLSQAGVESRIVPCRDGRIDLEEAAARTDRRTRLIIVSLISYKTGHRIDLTNWARMARACGALLFVDAVQALGAVEVEASQADFLCAASYKWLLGQHGLAIFYVNPALGARVAPPYAGYRGVRELFPPGGFAHYDFCDDARRYEEGMPNYPALYVLANALARLSAVGIDRISAHNAALTDRLMAGLLAAGLEPLTPTQPLARGAIVSIEAEQPERIVAELGERGVHIWGRDGRVRLSPHLYNDEGDIDRALATLLEIARPRLRPRRPRV